MKKIHLLIVLLAQINQLFATRLVVNLDKSIVTDTISVYKFDDYYNRNLKPWKKFRLEDGKAVIDIPLEEAVNANIIYFNIFNKSVGYVVHEQVLVDTLFITPDSNGTLIIKKSKNLFEKERKQIEQLFTDFSRYEKCGVNCIEQFEKGCDSIINSLFYKTTLRYSVAYVAEKRLIEQQKNKSELYRKYHLKAIYRIENDDLRMNEWGYVSYLTSTITTAIMNTSDAKYPIRKYISIGDLKDFVFTRNVFERKDLETFAQFHKLHKLIKHNDSTLILNFMDSIAENCPYYTIKTIIQNYTSQNRKSKRSIEKHSLAPDFLLKNHEGDLKRLADYKGKYVLLDFWATWCKPCIKKMKEFTDLQNKFINDLQIISISVDDSFDKMVKFKLQNNYSWVFLFNGTDKLLQELYSVKWYPTYILIDREGFVVKTIEDLNELDKLVEVKK